MAPKRELSDKFIDDADASLEEEEEDSNSENEKKPKKKVTKKVVTKKSPPKKKLKSKKGSNDEEDDEDDLGEGSSGGLETNKDGDCYLNLGPQKRVTIRKYKGSILIDIRETYSKDGIDGLPGKKGISLTQAQYETMKASMSLIDEAIDAC